MPVGEASKTWPLYGPGMQLCTALPFQDVYGAVERIKAEGGRVTREAGPVKGGTTVIAFVKDPSGCGWRMNV